jgi:type II secretory pathway pseudopilin PulG
MTGLRRHRSEAGMTIVEISVAVALLLAVSAVFLPILATASRTVRPMQMQSQSIDSLRNALAAIGREMRSAACVSAPTSVAPDNVGNTLTFVTDANNTTYEVTYTITAGQLTRQVTGEDAVTLLDTGLVNPSDAFTHIATPRRTVKVSFHFQHDPSRPVLDLSTVIAGRNAWAATQAGC